MVHLISRSDTTKPRALSTATEVAVPFQNLLTQSAPWPTTATRSFASAPGLGHMGVIIAVLRVAGQCLAARCRAGFHRSWWHALCPWRACYVPTLWRYDIRGERPCSFDDDVWYIHGNPSPNPLGPAQKASNEGNCDDHQQDSGPDTRYENDVMGWLAAPILEVRRRWYASPTSHGLPSMRATEWQV